MLGHQNHERVHNDSIVTKKNGTITLRNLHIKSDRLKISGDCDAVEFIPSPEGITLNGFEGTYTISVVEYKTGGGHSFDADLMQAVAQAVCLEEMFCCNVEYVNLYYIKTKKKEKVFITQEHRDKLDGIVADMHTMYHNHHTPSSKEKKNCSGCSLADICLPKICINKNVQKYIAQNIE